MYYHLHKKNYTIDIKLCVIKLSYDVCRVEMSVANIDKHRHSIA